MKALYLCVMVAFAASLAASPSVDAGTQDGAVFALCARAHTTKSATTCTTWKPTISCDDYNTEWPVRRTTDVYLVIAQAYAVAGVAGATCGIYYNPTVAQGVDVFGWTLCADQEFPDAGIHGEWPAAGGGNRIVWSADTNCQRAVIADYGVHAVAGAFYLYAYTEDVFQVTPDWNLGVNPVLAVVDCDGSTTYRCCWSTVGSVGFHAVSSYGGCNPCTHSGTDCIRDTPVVRSTWGAIKRAY